MSQQNLIATNRDTGALEEVPVVVDLTRESPEKHFWANHRDPSDPADGHIIVPLWPISPTGMKLLPCKGDRFKKEWRGGQYVRGPIHPATGLAYVGVPIRVRSYLYAKMICEPTGDGIQLAEWPEKMTIKSIAPRYRDKFDNQNRWK